MKILLLGKDGQVGWELQRSLSTLGDVVACNRKEADFERPETLKQLVRNICPDIVVNAAAYTAVDRAESEPELARRVNVESVGVLAEEIKRQNAQLIHYSTDYVFDGMKQGFYSELDSVSPQNVYGETKLAGEEAIAASGCKNFIFRTSWVYALRGKNFIKTILRLARERVELRIINDQIGAPTSAELIADVTALALYRSIYDESFTEKNHGLYHLVAGGETSWHGFAKFVVEEAISLGAKFVTKPQYIFPISTDEYPLPARRPANSRLDSQKLRTALSITLPPWQIHVRRMLAELIQENQ